MGQQPGWAYIYICGTFFLCLKLLHGTEKAEAQLQLSLVRQVCIERVHRAAHVHVLHSLNDKKASYPCSFFQPRKNEHKKVRSEERRVGKEKRNKGITTNSK